MSSERGERAEAATRERLITEVGQAIRENQTAVDAVDEAASRRLGVNRTDLRVMDIIEQNGGRMTAGAIADAAHLTTGAVTTLVDRLEKKGYLKRARDKEDRRKVLVELTPKAKKRLGEIYGPIGQQAYETLKQYSDKELKLFRDFILRGRDFLRQHTERTGSTR